MSAMKEISNVICVAKPLDRNNILPGLPSICHASAVENMVQPETIDQDFPFVFFSNPMKDLVRRLCLIAPTERPVLIQGESGTGKDTVAKLLHAYSHRKHQPLVRIHCGSIPEQPAEIWWKAAHASSVWRRLFSSELIPPEINSGTLVLDNVDELPKPFQADLLRIINRVMPIIHENHQPDWDAFRVVTTTKVNLAEKVRNRQFIGGLLYKISAISLTVPPLRERHDDINYLIDLTVKKIHSELISSNYPLSSLVQISHEAREFLMNYNWPGNLHELYNTLARTILWSENNLICPDILKGFMHD
ncbi:MAG: sigma-54-dependent Fis family transcriptional regulator [Magnetococcales bacterium]|nr:sigma-54-dependent Fis family transcriptional regulator [Magnetococcales bacterium]